MSGVIRILQLGVKKWAAVMLLLAGLSGGIGCASVERTAELERFEFEEPQMGVPFRLIFYAENAVQAEAAAAAAFARVAELNQIMSDYETDSEVSQLSYSSGSGRTVELSEDLWNVLAFAQEISRETGGAFDVTIGPCVGLWRKARREKELPEPWRVEHFLERVGYTNLVLHPETRSATLLREHMRLDLGGIAKGYAADEALKILERAGCGRALVAASGDLAIGAPPPGEKGWTVGVAGSDLPGAAPAFTVHLANAAVATSGDLSQRLEINGVRYSHILNPFTCVGMTNHALATVVAERCTVADPLATTMTILEPEEALALAAKREVAVRITRLQDGQPVIYRNEAFADLEKRGTAIEPRP